MLNVIRVSNPVTFNSLSFLVYCLFELIPNETARCFAFFERRAEFLMTTAINFLGGGVAIGGAKFSVI